MADSRFFARQGPFSLGELAAAGEASLATGVDPDTKITDVGPLDTDSTSILSFFHNKKYLDQLAVSQAAACVLEEKYAAKAAEGMALLISEDPHRSFALIAQLFYPEETADPAIDDSAIIHPSAVIAEGCEIRAGAIVQAGAEIGANSKIKENAVIGKNCVIGEACVIGENVTISHTIMGDRCVVLAGAVLGQRGYGFAMGAKGFVNIPQVGRVVVGNDVEIGANTTIDRGSQGDTIIGDSCMLDNLVQIGHNAQMGHHCVIVAHCSLAGSVKLGNFVVMGGHSSVNGHTNVADGTQLGPMSGIMSDTKPGDKLGGAPAIDLKEYWRRQIAIAKLTRKK
jgi:UDP-3-O-[3-hydroxymyristoyl] glucosamine N-acyltransferase